MKKEDWLKLDSFLWRFLTDFTHCISARDLKEAIRCLETAITVIKNLEEERCKSS